MRRIRRLQEHCRRRKSRRSHHARLLLGTLEKKVLRYRQGRFGTDRERSPRTHRRALCDRENDPRQIGRRAPFRRSPRGVTASATWVRARFAEKSSRQSSGIGGPLTFDMASARSIIAFSFVASRSSIEATRPWCLKRRTSRIRRIDNLWVGIGLPHWLNEKPVARLNCRPKPPAPSKRCDEAEALYLRYRGQKIGDDPWGTAILADFRQFRQA